MFRFGLIFFSIISFAGLNAQALISKESFFPPHHRLPKDYKAEISESKWEYLGTYRSDNGKTVLPDSPQPALIVYENGQSYRRIKGKKIVSNAKPDNQKIIFLDDTRLILEAKDEKGRYRSLYQKVGKPAEKKKSPVKIKGTAIRKHHGREKQV
jgi:hypothetical protein